MAEMVEQRDYRLGGEAEQAAIAAGLAEADWYRTSVDPGTLQQLAQRSNAPAARNALLYFTLLIGSGVLAYLTLWSWWSIPLLFLYGTMYGSSADPRWHECGHGTAFENDRINNAIYYVASFMLLRDPTVWRWSHVRHHSDTIVVGRDPEVILERPPNLVEWALGFFSILSGPRMMSRTVRHAMGNISDADRSYIPEDELPKVAWEARAFVALWAAVIVWCIAGTTLLPLLFFIGPSFYGAWLVHAFGTTQHLGLQEDVLDHRLNTRTIYMNPVLRFLYWNMNYHCEHHMFPTVPSHALPKLHQLIKDDLPEPKPSIVAAYREIMPALRKQQADPTYELDRFVPGLSGPSEGSGQSRADPAASGAADATVDSSDDPSALTFTAEAGDGRWVDVCSVDALSNDQVARVDSDDATYALYRVKGEYFATDGVCTHSKRVHLSGGLVINGQIECPKHNGRFRIADGEPMRAPVREALGCHEVRVEGTRVQLKTRTEVEPQN